MAEVPQITQPLFRSTTENILFEIRQLIEINSFLEIEEIFENLQPSQRMKILNSTINGCTPLFLAIQFNRIEIIRYLLKLSLRQGTRALTENWKKCRHPLLIAMNRGMSNLFLLISISLYDINDYFHGQYTPLVCAIITGKIEYVDFLVKLGADINRVCLNSVSPLMVSAYTNSSLCQFFVSKNADLNYQDEDGHTALHTAITNEMMESLKILVNAGADVRIKTKQGITPLMWAALRVNLPMFHYFTNHPAYSELEKIEALEILNASNIYCQQPIITYWIDALKMRKSKFPKKTPYPVQEILDYLQEFTTEIQLKEFLKNPLHLAFQAILVIERIFGRNNPTYLLFFLKTALIAKKTQNVDKLRQLIDYIQDYCQSHPAHFIDACSGSFKMLFMEITGSYSEKLFRNEVFSLFRVIARTTGVLWSLHKDKFYARPYCENVRYLGVVNTFLYMASTIRNMNPPQHHLDEFFAEVTKLVKEDPRVLNQQSLLHYVVKNYMRKPWYSIVLLRVLLRSSADVNSMDYFRRTPLMYALKHLPDDHLQEVVDILLANGTRLDTKNSEGFSAIDFVRWTSLSFPKNPVSQLEKVTLNKFQIE